MSQAIGTAVAAEHRHLEEKTYKKVALRLVPFLFLCYLAAYLDRVNVGFAKLQMLDDLGFSSTVYGLGAGIFFLGYVLFEVPSNIILHKVGARLWIARIMITWGLIAATMVFVKTPAQFYTLRFLLGVAEAGFIPGVLLYLTYWFPASRRGRIVALFLAAIPMSSIFGGPLSGWILQSFSDFGGLRGWQWLFLVETIPSLVLGVVTLFYLDDRVSSAKWLNDEEKRVVSENVTAETKSKQEFSTLADAFRSGRVWLLGVAYFCFANAIYVISFWLPTLIRQKGVTSPLDIGLLTVIPYTVAIVAMIMGSASADRNGERRWHTVVPCFLTGLGLILSASTKRRRQAPERRRRGECACRRDSQHHHREDNAVGGHGAQYQPKTDEEARHHGMPAALAVSVGTRANHDHCEDCHAIRNCCRQADIERGWSRSIDSVSRCKRLNVDPG